MKLIDTIEISVDDTPVQARKYVGIKFCIYVIFVEIDEASAQIGSTPRLGFHCGFHFVDLH